MNWFIEWFVIWPILFVVIMIIWAAIQAGFESVIDNRKEKRYLQSDEYQKDQLRRNEFCAEQNARVNREREQFKSMMDRRNSRTKEEKIKELREWEFKTHKK